MSILAGTGFVGAGIFGISNNLADLEEVTSWKFRTDTHILDSKYELVENKVSLRTILTTNIQKETNWEEIIAVDPVYASKFNTDSEDTFITVISVNIPLDKMIHRDRSKINNGEIIEHFQILNSHTEGDQFKNYNVITKYRHHKVPEGHKVVFQTVQD